MTDLSSYVNLMVLLWKVNLVKLKDMITKEEYWKALDQEVREYLSMRYFHTTRCLLSEENMDHIYKEEMKFITEVNDVKYRREIYQYFRWKEWGYETTITSVRVFKDEKQTTIEIETHRPGILIGKAGHFINGLEEHLAEEFKEENIKIDLRECKMWYNLYK